MSFIQRENGKDREICLWLSVQSLSVYSAFLAYFSPPIQQQVAPTEYPFRPLNISYCPLCFAFMSADAANSFMPVQESLVTLTVFIIQWVTLGGSHPLLKLCFFFENKILTQYLCANVNATQGFIYVQYMYIYVCVAEWERERESVCVCVCACVCVYIYVNWNISNSLQERNKSSKCLNKYYVISRSIFRMLRSELQWKVSDNIVII